MESGAPRERMGGILEDFDPNHPDAMLIECAPELLAALEDILPLACPVGSDEAHRVDMARATIAKAKGVKE